MRPPCEGELRAPSSGVLRTAPGTAMRPPAGAVRSCIGVDLPAFVVHVEPANGATGILRDSPVVTRLSRRVDGRSLSASTFRVEDDRGPVPARLDTSLDGLVVVWWPQRLLTPGAEHRVAAEGLRDAVGRIVPTNVSRFVAGGFAGTELRGLDAPA